MLGDIVGMIWRETADGFEGRPAEPLPDAFSLLAPDTPADNPIAPSSLSGASMRLHPPALWRGAPMVVFDLAMKYDWAHQVFLLGRSELARVLERSERLRAGPLRPVTDVSAGVCGMLTDPPARVGFAAQSGFDPYRLSTDGSNRVWLDPAGLALEPGPPDAIAFHDDAPPQSISLTLEATTACNFRCGFCYGRHMKQGVLRLPQFERLLNNTPGLAAVEFTGEGEPLMNKDTPAMIAACKARGAWVHLTTNGSRMTDVRAEMILDLGVDSMAMSLESTDPDAFAKLRPGGRLSDLIDAAAKLRAAIARRGSGPVLRLWVSLLRSQLARIDQFLEFAVAHGFDLVEFQALNTLPSYMRFYPGFFDGETSDFAAIDRALRTPGVSAEGRAALTELRDGFTGQSCHRMSHVLAPTYQGEVSPCCMLKVPDFPSVGDLTETPLQEIWDQPGFRRFRMALRHGVILNSCDGCITVAGGTQGSGA